MQAHFQRQPRHHRQRSRPFPWVRLIIAAFLTALFLLGAALQILSTGNVISSYWLLIIPPFITMIALLIPLYQWLFPISPDDTTTHPSQPQQPPSTHPTTQNAASELEHSIRKNVVVEQHYPYDVTISYAGEDRDYAQALAEALKAHSVNVFYDRYEKATLWGKNLYDYLSDLYQNQAHYCIMLLSEHYAQKVWTTHEREAAQNRAVREHEEYILPIRLDTTDLPGHLQTLVYLNWHEETVETITLAILEKLGKATQQAPAPTFGNLSPPQTSIATTSQKTKEEWLDVGNTLYNLKQYKEALAAYEQAIRLDPNDIIAYTNKGHVLRNLKRYKEALAAYEQAIRLDPKNAVAYTNKGDALDDLKRYKEALAAYEQAIRLDPNYALVHNNKGYSLRNLKRYEEALAAYEQAIRLDPNDAVAYTNKGIALNNLKRYEEALAAYEQAIRLDPNDAIAYNNKGIALNNLERYEEALAAYERATRLDPNYALAYGNKGYMLYNLERYEEALAAYEQVIRLAPNDPLTYANKGETLYNLERYGEALAAYEQAIHLAPNDPLVYKSKGYALQKLGRRKDAQQAFVKARQLNSTK